MAKRRAGRQTTRTAEAALGGMGGGQVRSRGRGPSCFSRTVRRAHDSTLQPVLPPDQTSWELASLGVPFPDKIRHRVNQFIQLLKTGLWKCQLTLSKDPCSHVLTG